MRTLVLFLTLLFLTKTASAQSANTPDFRSAAYSEPYEVLADRGYTVDRVHTDRTLRFVAGDSLRPDKADCYWVRLIVSNPSRYDEPYWLSVKPALNNTLYYFDADSQRWLFCRGGANVPSFRQRNYDALPFVAYGGIKTVLYLKVDVHLLRDFNRAIQPVVAIQKQAVTDSVETFAWITWVVSLAVLLLFFLNNLFIYVNFRDKIIFYYLLIQIGGMLYITDYKQFFHVLLPNSILTLNLSADGYLHIFDLGSVLQQAGILLMLYGQVQLTRAYLNTSDTLPRLDSVLTYGLYMYLLVSTIFILTSSFLINLDEYVILYQNMYLFVLIGVIIGTCVAGYIEKLPSAKPLLVASSLPLAFMLVTTVFNVFVNFIRIGMSILPDLAIITQTLAFSIAVVSRIKSIQRQLVAKKIETQQLEFSIREIEFRNRLTELENQKINEYIRHEKTKNELLQERLDINQRELASTTMYIVQKNEMLANLKLQLQKLNKQHPGGSQHGLKGIESILQSNLYLDADWGKFKVHFEQVHPNFFENLLAKHPTLTKYEIRLYAYFHINLSTKEIAALLNIDPASVRRAKTRLYKKMAIAEPDGHTDRVE